MDPCLRTAIQTGNLEHTNYSQNAFAAIKCSPTLDTKLVRKQIRQHTIMDGRNDPVVIEPEVKTGASCIQGQGQVVTETFYENISHVWRYHRQ